MRHNNSRKDRGFSAIIRLFMTIMNKVYVIKHLAPFKIVLKKTTYGTETFGFYKILVSHYLKIE